MGLEVPTNDSVFHCYVYDVCVCVCLHKVYDERYIIKNERIHNLLNDLANLRSHMIVYSFLFAISNGCACFFRHFVFFLSFFLFKFSMRHFFSRCVTNENNDVLSSFSFFSSLSLSHTHLYVKYIFTVCGLLSSICKSSRKRKKYTHFQAAPQFIMTSTNRIRKIHTY